MDVSESIINSWQRVVENVRTSGDIGPSQMGFLDLARPQGLIANTLLLAVPNEMTRDILENELHEHLASALTDVFGTDINCAYSIDNNMHAAPPEIPAAPQQSTAPEQPVDNVVNISEATQSPVETSAPDEPLLDELFSSKTNPAAAPGGGLQQNVPPHSGERSRLNEHYHFDNFITGSSNRFAHAAAYAVAEQPAKSYNPLFIYGESGLGKTHLLHAIGHYAQELFPGLRVRYVNSEEFTNDFINSIRHDEGASFKQIYRNVDILLIDDIQFMANKEATVEEFFHTFNALYNNNKQVVITSDLPPKQLSGFEERLRSRFEWGLTTDIQPPDLETRIAILAKKADAEGIKVPSDALEYIASRIDTNIRELEGALTRVTAYASLNNEPINLEQAQYILKDLISDDDAQEITSDLIMDETANYFGFSIADLQSKSRTRTLVTARQIAMYLLRELTEMSLPRIGAEFGGRDHTTVMHADRKIRDLMSQRHAIYNQVTELTNKIKQRARNI